MAKDDDSEDFETEEVDELEDDFTPDEDELEGDLEEVDLEGDLDGELDDDAIVDLEEDVLDDVVVEVEDEGSTLAKRPAAAGDDEDDDDEDELDPDDVEASLDDILKDRLVIEEVEPDDDEDTPEPEDRTDGTSAVVPKRPDEFVCQSCFLVKHPSQLADAARMLCRDCV